MRNHAIAIPGRIRNRLTLVLVICLGLQVGCTPTSRRPLSNVSAAKSDNQLLGVWRSVAPGAETEYVHVGKSRLPNSPVGLMQAMGVAHDRTSRVIRFSLNGYFFVTEVNGERYANLMPPESQEGGLRSLLAGDSYTFVKYKVSGDTLEVWMLDEAEVAAAIARGDLKGQVRVQSGQTRRLVIDDHAGNIIRYLTAGGSKVLFPAGRRLVYERVKP